MTDTTQFQKKISALYAMIGAGAIMTMIPYSFIPFAGMSCLIVAVFACYLYRFQYKGNQVMGFHTRHLIRTFWLSNIIIIAGIILFGSIIFLNGDMTALNTLFAAAEKGVIANESDVMRMQITFVHANEKLIKLAALISLLPYPFYLIYRVTKGIKILNQK